LTAARPPGADTYRLGDAERARRRRRRQRWLNVVLLALLVPMVLAAWFRIGPLMSAPVRMAVKLAALLVPLLFVLVVLARLRRR
jgi:hypothetical protein